MMYCFADVRGGFMLVCLVPGLSGCFFFAGFDLIVVAWLDCWC